MRKAVIVGIDNYPNYPLSGCVNDANAIAKLLERNDDNSNSVNFSVKLQCNIGTKSELKQHIKSCFSDDTEVALFYFSGHGYVDSFGGYIVTPDLSEYDMGVSMQDILWIVNNSKCKNKVVILDCCYAGFMGSSISAESQISTIGEGVTILAACRAKQTAIIVNEYGLFTSLLLQALDGGAADLVGNTTLGGIYSYIEKALDPFEQRPIFKTNATRFFSIRKVIPQVELEILRKIPLYFMDLASEFELDSSFEHTNNNADENNVKIFNELQKLVGLGLVAPCEEDHMYYAAINSKSCKLTITGQYYWRLVKNNLI